MQRSKTELIVLHTSATPPSWDIGAAEIRNLHMAPKTEHIRWGVYIIRGKGWSDIGYHLVIRRDGLIEFGRAANAVGAHVLGYNRISFGIVMVGGVDEQGKSENNYTEAQWKSVDHAVHFSHYAFPDAKILGHRDLSPDLDGDGKIEQHEWTKDCPCFDARGRWQHEF